MNKTKMIATIGPSSKDENVIRNIIMSGADVIRINMSHASSEFAKDVILKTRKISSELNVEVGIMIDTRGPEIRIGTLENDKVKLIKDRKIRIVKNNIVGNENMLSVSLPAIIEHCKIGEKILVNDGNVELEVEATDGETLICNINNDGFICSNCSINIPNASFNIKFLSNFDKDTIRFASMMQIDYLALSLVNSHLDVLDVNDLLIELNDSHIQLISKIENKNAIDEIDNIIKMSDGIMISRGDLGIEVELEKIPSLQKKIATLTKEKEKICIVATEMLASMQYNPRPTRAEVSDVANAVYDTTGAIMLSGECAMGKYPVECVQAMSKISKAIEADTNYWKRFNKNATSADFNDIESHVAYTTCVTAQNMKAAGIVAYTHKGDSVRKLAGFGAGCPIFAITDDEKTFNQLSVSFNVVPVLVMGEKTIEDTICKGIKKIKADELVEAGDILVISGGSKILPSASENKVFGGMVRI